MKTTTNAAGQPAGGGIVRASALQINGIEMVPIEYEGRRVLTMAMMEEVHRRPEGTAGRNFRENRDRLIVDEDYLEVTADDIRRQSLGHVFPPRTPKGILLTETGYSMLVKSFTDDLAWDVQRQLVKSYLVKAAPARALSPAEMFLHNAQMMVDIERRQSEQAAAVTRIEQRVDMIADSQLMLARPAGAESIVHMRARINDRYGLPARIVDEIVRQSPYSPKPAGMVRNGHEDALGGSFAVYWTKDVNMVFARFVAECAQVTATQATHPLIAGRFKLTASAGKGTA